MRVTPGSRPNASMRAPKTRRTPLMYPVRPVVTTAQPGPACGNVTRLPEQLLHLTPHGRKHVVPHRPYDRVRKLRLVGTRLDVPPHVLAARQQRPDPLLPDVRSPEGRRSWALGQVRRLGPHGIPGGSRDDSTFAVKRTWL